MNEKVRHKASGAFGVVRGSDRPGFVWVYLLEEENENEVLEFEEWELEYCND
jgi:hypothetical protein